MTHSAKRRPRHGYHVVQDHAFAVFLHNALHAGLDAQLDAPVPPALRRLIEEHAAHKA